MKIISLLLCFLVLFSGVASAYLEDVQKQEEWMAKNEQKLKDMGLLKEYLGGLIKVGDPKIDDVYEKETGNKSPFKPGNLSKAVVTPWNCPDIWGNTWQGDVVMTFNGLGRYLGKLWGEAVQEDIKAKRRQNPWLDVMDSNRLKSLDKLKDLANSTHSKHKVGIIIDHLEENKERLQEKGKDLFPGFQQLLEDLKHIYDYEEELQEATINTTIAAGLIMLFKMAVLAL